MSNPIFICYWIPSEEAVHEFGARRVTHTLEAVHEKQARAKATLRFMEQYPEADDTNFQLYIYPDAPGFPRTGIDLWNEEMLYEYEWDDKNNRPGNTIKMVQPKAVKFEKLSKTIQICTLVKFRTTEIDTEQLFIATKLTQDDAATFEGHLVEAISKMPAIVEMYPDRIIEAIEFIEDKCYATAKWPEMKGAAATWLKQHEQDRKDGNTTDVTPPVVKMGSGDPERFDLVLALLILGKEPEKSGATDVKNAKHVKETRDPAWRNWRTTLIGIPGIYYFPENLLYELTLDGMKNLNLINDSEGRLTYVRERFAGHPLLPDYSVENNNEAEQNTESATVTLAHDTSETGAVESQQPGDATTARTLEAKAPVEKRTGPFYYRAADGSKIGRANKFPRLQEVIADGFVEISQEEYQARKSGEWKEENPAEEQKASAQPEVKNIGGGRFSIEGLTPEQPDPTAQAEQPSNEAEKAEVTPVQPDAHTFQSIGTALENDLAGKGDNMKIWRSVMRTDPRYTKDLAGAGFEGTSINAEYMIMRATEIFGPIGTGWGFEVIEDRMLPGAPMSEAIYEDKKFIGNRLLRDGDGTLITEKNHSIKIKFWYSIEGEIRGEVEAYGATKYLYKTKHGITCDGEAQKKSLTDAIKKALSLLGFSADVWLGLYDQAEYKTENAIEFDIRNASDKAEDVTRIRKELDEKFKLNTDSMRSAVTPNEVSGIASSLTRVMGVHLKAAREKGDVEYTKYLEGRLRRLEEVKTECLTKLQENAA